MPDKPFAFCGECGEHYPETVRECASYEKTLVVWRPTTEPEERPRSWWSVVNRLGRKQRT